MPTLHLIDLSQHHPNKQLVYVATGRAMYVRTDATSVTEEAIVGPVFYCRPGNLAAESFFGAFEKQSKAHVTKLRPSNVHGPNRRHRRAFGVIPVLFLRLRTCTEMDIWGSGAAVRDHLYVDDFRPLCLALLHQRATPGESPGLHAAAGIATTRNKICDIAEVVTGLTLRRRYLVAATVNACSIVLDSAHVQRLLGWRPEIDLAVGLARSWADHD
jgi:UDP-glucose 4-epimerase